MRPPLRAPIIDGRRAARDWNYKAVARVRHSFEKEDELVQQWQSFCRLWQLMTADQRRPTRDSFNWSRSSRQANSAASPFSFGCLTIIGRNHYSSVYLHAVLKSTFHLLVNSPRRQVKHFVDGCHLLLFLKERYQRSSTLMIVVVVCQRPPPRQRQPTCFLGSFIALGRLSRRY